MKTRTLHSAVGFVRVVHFSPDETRAVPPGYGVYLEGGDIAVYSATSGSKPGSGTAPIPVSD